MTHCLGKKGHCPPTTEINSKKHIYWYIHIVHIYNSSKASEALNFWCVFLFAKFVAVKTHSFTRVVRMVCQYDVHARWVWREREKERERERETDRQTDRQRDWDRQRETQRDRDRLTERLRQTDKERQRDRDRLTETQRDRDKNKTDRDRQGQRRTDREAQSMCSVVQSLCPNLERGERTPSSNIRWDECENLDAREEYSLAGCRLLS